MNPEKLISDLIARLPIPGLQESNTRHLTAKTLTTVLGVKVLPSQVAIKESVLRVKMPPVVKSAVRMRTADILKALSEVGIEINKIQ
jgi:hypothetical protein